MQVELTTPSAIEGSWKIFDAEGNEIMDGSKHPGAKLVLMPSFYQGTYSQTLLCMQVLGKRGKALRGMLRVAAASGRVTCESADKPLKLTTPKFDQISVKE